MRILVVEDETEVASFLQRGLREEGYTVEVATNGEQKLVLSEIMKSTTSSFWMCSCR